MTHSWGGHGWATVGILGNNIHVCYSKHVQNGNLDFCELVDTVAHELAHKGGVQKIKNHNSPSQADVLRDKVYELGGAAHRGDRRRCRLKH